jgi:hypothetical protein
MRTPDHTRRHDRQRVRRITPARGFRPRIQVAIDRRGRLCRPDTPAIKAGAKGAKAK